MIEHKCLSCNRKTLSIYCEQHYLLKEARYAIYDLENDHYKNESEKEFFIELAITRLIDLAKYALKKETTFLIENR